MENCIIWYLVDEHVVEVSFSYPEVIQVNLMAKWGN